MNYHVMTLFPEMIEQGMNTSIMGRAMKQELLSLETVNIRDFTQDKHHRVDDYTYGGGAGMLMQAQPIFDAYTDITSRIPKDHKVRLVYLTPQGRPFTQQMAQKLADNDDLIFLCGHYEGIDERVLEEIVTDPVSIGDYVLTGGELPAMVMMDAIARLVPGVLHNEVSADTESFHGGLLEYPQYTRPEVWHDKKVPEVLLSGNLKDVSNWRMEKSIARTRERRPDLYEGYQRMAAIRKDLMKQKLLHTDMIDLIDSGYAALVGKVKGCILLKSTVDDICYFTNLEPDVISTEDFFSQLYDMTAGQIGQSIPALILHQPKDQESVSEILDRRGSQMFLVAYTVPEQLSLSKFRKFQRDHEVSGSLETFITEEVNERIKLGRKPYTYLAETELDGIEDLGNMGIHRSRSAVVIL